MDYNLIEVLNLITNSHELNINAMIRVLGAESRGFYNEKSHRVEFFTSDEEGNETPSMSYQEYFYSHFEYLVFTEKKYWLDIENVINNPKLPEQIEKRRKLIFAHLTIVKSKKPKRTEKDSEKYRIAEFLIESIDELHNFYVVLIKACKSEIEKKKKDRIKLDLSVRQIATLLMLLMDQKVINEPGRSRTKIVELIVGTFNSRGQDEENSFRTLYNMFDEYKLTESPDFDSLQLLAKLLENLQKKIDKILN